MYDSSGAPVAEGLAKRSALALPPGEYTMDISDLSIESHLVRIDVGRGDQR